MKKLLWILYQPYKWIVFIPLIALSTLFFGSLAVILVFFIKPKIVSFLCGTIWARFNAYLTPILVQVYGRENVDRNQSYVIVSNHQSQYDILVIYGWLGMDFKWVMKQELRRVPALGIACERLGHIYINRANHAAAIASLQEAKNNIVKGTSIMFFPEGTRSKDGKLGEFKKGAFRTAIELGLPVLPVTIKGTNNILPSRTLDLFPGRVKMIIHKPIETGINLDNLSSMIEKAREAIRMELSE